MIDLSKIRWRTTRHEGIHLCFLRRDEATGDSTVLIRMEPGSSYPAHRHVGVEEVFVLQGGYADARGAHRAGDYDMNEAGSAHAPKALEETGEDCIMLAVARGGIETLKSDE
jgi:anti-sigma factor ChrR (cupin superfamily)